MKQRYTAAHWGAYQAKGVGAALKLAPLASDPSPSTIGEGWLDAVQDYDLRILKPAIRKGWLERRDTTNRCQDEFVEVDWDTALDLAAGELKRVIANHGNEAIFAGSYGWASAGRFHHAQSQLRRFLNEIGGCTSSVTTYSHGAAEVLLPYITGMSNRTFQDQMTSLKLVAKHCELLVCFGGISGRTAQINSSGTSRHEVETWLDKATANGMHTVNIAPQRTDMAKSQRAQWLPIRPNTDVALMLGLAHTLCTNDLHDTRFLEKYCTGWDIFEAYLLGKKDGTPKSASWAAAICDIPHETITALAHNMAAHKTMITATWGMQRADHGEQPLWMALTLAAMLGQIGQPGTGFGFGYGSTTAVGRPHKLMPWPSVPQGQNPIDSFIPVARITDMLMQPGETYKFDGQIRTYPETKLIYWAGGNPFHHHQDLNRLEEAWTRPDTIIVNDHWWTATAKRADIIFPVTTALERHDIMLSRRDPTLLWMDKLLDAPGDAREDHAVFAGLAKRMGTFDAFTEGKNTEQWLRYLWAGAQKTALAAGFELPAFEAFREAGIFECPSSDENRIQFEDFIKNPDQAPLNTASGKIEIHSSAIKKLNLDDCPAHPTWLEPTEWLGSPMATDGALHLISGQPLTRLHGQLDNGTTSKAPKINGREPVYLHPDLAAKHQITEGDIVCLSNARGKCLAAAVITDAIRPDTISLATGAWFDPQIIDGERIEVHGNPNALTLDKGSSELSQGNIAHTTLVWLSKWDKPLPPVGAHKPPRIQPAID